MFRKFFSATALVSVVAAGLSFSSHTHACPAPDPKTLLWLYQNSSEIHLARYAKTEDVSVQSDEEEYSEVSVRLHFDISSTLKGEARKIIGIDQVEYRSKRSEEAEEVIEPEPDGDDGVEESSEYEVYDAEHPPDEEEYVDWKTPGESVLLFLVEKGHDDGDEGSAGSIIRPVRKDKKEPVLLPTGGRDGIKHVAADDIGIFETRIKELNSIYDGDTRARDHELIEWMIRCMEERATLWDGAYELNRSFAALDRIENAADHEGSDEDRPWVRPSDESDAKYARLVTNTQMDRISNILMTQDQPKSSKRAFSPFIPDGDSALIALVERWAGADVAKFLLQRLRNGRADPWETRWLMDSIATMLEDDDLGKAAESYGDIGYGEDTDMFEADEPDETKSDSESAVDETPNVGSPDDAENADTAEGKPTGKKPPRTYLEVRNERLAAFIALADAFLAKPEVQLELTLKASAAARDR